MTKFADKAREIKNAGEAERGNFEPTGAPLRVYNYWLNETNSKRGREIRYGRRRENFCHFWRVVAIWAPVMFMARKAEKVVVHPAFVLLALALIVTSFSMSMINFAMFREVFFGLLAIIAIGAIGLVGILSGVSMAQDDDDARYQNDLPRAAFAKWGMLAFPISIPAFLLTKVYRMGYAAHLAVTALVLMIASMIVAGIVTEGFLATLMVIGFVIGLLAFLFGVIVGMTVLSDIIAGRRKIARDKALDARYDYFDEHGHFPEDEGVAPRKPGKISKFFTGVGDFLIFVSQVVRVNKWKICPLVEVDTK